jgi:hypothetical protein
MISLRTSCTTIFPFTSEAKVVGALSTDVVVTKVVVEKFCVGIELSAVNPKTGQRGFVRGVRDRG